MGVDQVVKRDGRVVPFDRGRIERAIYSAARAVGNGEGKPWAEMLSWAVVGILEERYGQKGQAPQVEEIQDVVEEVLIKSGHPTVAKAYILYRQKRADARAAERMLMDTEKLVDDYLQKLDWRINENSNMNYSLQGLNFYLASSIAARYWLHKIYPPEVQTAHTEGALHIHDLGMLSSYTYYGKEVVVMRVDGELRLTSFEQAYASCPEAETCLNEADGAFAKYPQGWQVLDQDGWTPVVRLVRKRKNEGMRFIKNRGGRSVIVTDNHPMITGSGAVRAADVAPRSDALYTVDLQRLLAGEGLFAETEIDLLAELFKAGVTRFGKDRIYFNGTPIDELDLSQAGDGLLHTHTRTIPRKIPLTADLGYLIGFILAEGYLSYDSDAPRTVSVTQKDAAPLHVINRVLIALGTPGCITRNSDTGVYELQCRNVFLRFLFENIFRMRPGARHKSLPERILHYNPEFVHGVLAGVIDGDGSLAGNGTSVIIRVSARTLLEQMACVLQVMGATPRDRNIEGVGSSRVYQGREVVQKYPLYGVAFRKTPVLTLPSTRFEVATISAHAWQDETRDEWHVVLNNEPTEIPDDDIYDITTESGTLIVNGMWNHNCSGWDLQDLLLQGFGGVSAKIESRPPRHLRTALGQLVNFFYTLQGEVAGAVAVSNLDTLLAPFIRYDHLDYTGIKQAVQEFVFNINVPTRVGFQSLVWDELVVVKNRGRIEVVEIGKLVDGQFDRNGHRILSQGHSSYAVANADDYRALTFDAGGQVHWAPIKAFIRHRVPQGSAFVRVRTSRGTAGVSQAHSMFAFAELNGHCTAQPIAANQVEIAHGNATLSPHNHLVAVRRIANEGSRRQLDLVELIDAVPQLAERVRVRDSGVVKSYPNWRAVNQDAPAEFLLDDQDAWYGRNIVGEGLEEFVRLVGRHITEERGAADELLDALVGQLVGTVSTGKVVPWFIYDLAPDLQELLIATLEGSGGNETRDYYDYTTTSKKLSLGLSLLLAMNGYNFSVYENSYDDRPSGGGRYTLRIYKDKSAPEGYDIGDLLARACTCRETFSYQREYEYDISVDAACENFAGGSGLLCFHNTPFTNVTMDLTPPSTLRDQAVVIGGELQEATYGEFQKEMDLFNHAFAEVMLDGDSKGRVMTFPIPTFNLTRDFDWENGNLEPVWKMTAKYGIPYFCLAEDTAVLLSDHTAVPIKQVQVGDLLAGANGSPARVSQVYHRKADKLVHITLKDGQVISATPIHRFPTEHGLKEAGQLTLGDKLVRTVGSTREYEPITNLQIVEGDFAVVDVTVDSKEHLFALSGGILSHNSNYINSDMNPEDARSMCPLSPDTQVLVKDSRDASVRTMQEVYDAYMKQGVSPQVLHNGEWHPAVPVATKTIGCREFALANGARVTMDLRHEQPARRGEDQPAELLQAAEIRTGMYLPFTGTPGEGDFRWYPVESIREVAGYSGPVYCFAVDSPEHLFQTANGLVTHNCRLRLDHRELRKRMGGLFAAAPLTGSAGVVTVNLPRLAYLAHDEDDFRKQLEQMMDISRTSLEIKRKMLETLTERGLYPYSRHYLQAVKAQTGGYWNHHFSTIGLIGMNEACLNLLGVGIADPKGKAFAVRTLQFMRDVILRYQQETGNLYNLEATPAEGASYRLARADKQGYPEIKTAGTDKTPYYSNSTQLPVNYSDDLFEVLDHQDDLQTLYTGGTVVHIFLGEQLNDWRQARRLVRTVAENYRLPYFTISPTFSICPVHGYIPGEHKYCPYEHTEEDLKRYGRELKR